MVNAQAAYESLADQKLYDGVPASLYAKEQVAQRRYQEFVLLRNKKSDMVLKAPRSGIISYRNAEVGSYVQAGTKLLTITDNSSFYIDCSISEYDAAVLATGNMINAEIEARELQNKLSHICPDAKIDFKIPTANEAVITIHNPCLLYTSPSPRD